MLGELFPLLVIFIVIGLPVLSATIISLAKILRDGSGGGTRSRHRNGDTPDEAELMQELHRGLTRLESRLDSLETIVLAGERSEKKAAHND